MSSAVRSHCFAGPVPRSFASGRIGPVWAACRPSAGPAMPPAAWVRRPLLRLAAAAWFVCVAAASATDARAQTPQGTAGQPADIRIGPDVDPVMAQRPRVVMDDASPVNTSANPGLAPTYLGRTVFHNRGAVRLGPSHIQINGETRGWDAGTCLLAVLANGPPGVSGCNQGGFWDANYRWVYPGQDSAAAFFGISGITPVIRDGEVESFGERSLTNPGGQRETVGTVTLKTPLDQAQVAAVNDAAGPMRVQVNNGFFAYTLSAGFTEGGVPVPAASSDGKTLLVDNWVRAIEPANVAARGTKGATATYPALPYWTPSGEAQGTNVLPSQVGATNGSPPLSHYSVTVDGNYLVEAQYGGFKITDKDVVNDARYVEIVGVNNKTGKPTWDELQPTNDQVDGKSMLTHLMFGGCQNDDGVGLGVCGAMMVGENGLKRVVVCSNPQSTELEGATDCVLDTSSTLGWKSTKSAGYVLWVDPGASGNPRAVLDWDGNMNTAGRLFVGAGNVGVTVSPDGTATATAGLRSGGNIVTTALLVPGSFAVAALPKCTTDTLGAHAFVTDARKPAERPGRGSGVPADCAPPRLGSPPAWLSVYNQAEVAR